ncbi:MAG: hypothetical protein P0Y49_07365 [Candidatus Pedobacter colombiensis]|uniref:Lipoprotein n=1 Tax=Candidatus Pedobacter colombiensis TaxID=3121371 RepID=A0AAJ6B844_9SPHI|nr:hypothetical protein [Pedobacter sp.]WEK20955.1 MAG: hypothetical protein P0Y49_07365 [Pedobacter sp.]
MKNYLIPILLILGFLNACTSGHETKGSAENHLVLKPFSDSVKVDTFKVALTGETLKDMAIQFTITAHDGKLIYNKDFKAADLIDNYKSTVDLKKERSQMDFIMNEYKLFLDDENFLEPAVTENENPDQYTPDKTFYNELKQSALNGFKYRTGKETSVYIAWSEKEKKVKPYYNCCK